MVTCPAVHDPRTTIATLRAFFSDDHVHIALLVHEGKLVGTVERADLAPTLGGEMHASAIARLDGRTIGPDDGLPRAVEALRRDGRRRLAVISSDSTLVGLLCLKQSGLGFCSDADVSSRRRASGVFGGDGPPS